MASTTGIGLKEKELETKAVNNCLDNLSEHLDIDPVLDKLLSKGLISAEKHSEIAKMVVDGKRRQAVRNAIEEIGLKPPGSLKSFIEVLKEDEKTKYLGDHVDEEYKRLTDDMPAQVQGVDETDSATVKGSHVEPVQETKAKSNTTMTDDDCEIPVTPCTEQTHGGQGNMQISMGNLHLQQGASININVSSNPKQATESDQSQRKSKLAVPVQQAKGSATASGCTTTATSVFVVYEFDEDFGECLEHFVEVLRTAGVNCDMDLYHAKDNITNWNIWCVEQIEKASNGGYVLLVCSPQLHDKLNHQSTDDDSDRVKMKVGFINSSTLRPLLDEGICFSRVIPIVPSSYKPQDCILSSLSTRSRYIIHFDQLMGYENIEKVQNNNVSELEDLVNLVARLTNQDLVSKPPVAAHPPNLQRGKKGKLKQ
ncbi:uncharacterized protein [Dysidea avara]|uniref:uncharacterized protein isoform X2 n=1 Tax=Dysidea avara TaxID=196820 RepID=UPI003321DD52